MTLNENTAGRGTRAKIMALLANTSKGMSSAELAEGLGMHHTAVRRHLDTLARAGVITSERAHDGGRGRPVRIFRMASGGLQDDVARQELLGLLLRLVTEISDDKIEEIGRAESRRLRPSITSRRGLIEEVGRLGFGPEEISTTSDAEQGALALRLCHCPFGSTVNSEGGRAVCTLHRGLVKGMAESAGGTLSRFDIDDASAGNCTVEFAAIPPPQA